MRGSAFVLAGSSVAAAGKARLFDRPLQDIVRKGGLPMAKPVVATYAQSKATHLLHDAKGIKKQVKRFLGLRSSRFIIDKLNGPVKVWESVIDDVGFQALTAIRDGGDTKPFKERLRIVHAVLYKFPSWISGPIGHVVGQWLKTIRRTEYVVALILDENEWERSLLTEELT